MAHASACCVDTRVDDREVTYKPPGVDTSVDAARKSACATVCRADGDHYLLVEYGPNVLDLNLRGAFLCAQGAVRHFLERGDGGAIVNVSSVHQLIPKPRFAGYSVSKGGMQNLTRTLALEYASRGIRVNGIGPGATITPINRSWIDDPVKRAAVESHIPMRRAGDSEEMAAVTAFLLSDDAAYITGQTLFVDGGLTLFPSFETTWSSE